MSRTPGSLQLERFVNEFITRYGTPRQVHTDQGTNFQKSHLFQEMCELLGVDKTRTTAFHPASDGLVERFNRTMECMLSMYVVEDQRDWDLRLPCLLMAYRGTPQESTQCSPNGLMLGRETELPIDLMYGTPKLVDETIDPRDREIYYIDMLRDRLEMAHAHARRSLQNSAVRQRETMTTRSTRANLIGVTKYGYLHQAEKLGYHQNYKHSGMVRLAATMGCSLPLTEQSQ